MKAKDRRLAELKAAVPEITPEEAASLQKTGAVLVDVREREEVAQGSPQGALRLGRGFLELKIEDAVPDMECTVMVMCAGGVRSLFAAEGLKRMGYADVRSIAGGFNSWKNKGMPFEIPQVLDDDARERYARHLLLPEVGEAGQLKLLNSKVLLVGAGGLGSPSAYYLAAAGVGTLGIVDHDVVDRSNLQRQILHNESRVGVSKAQSAKQTLEALNPKVNVIAHETHLSSDNVEEILGAYDVVVDGTDNLPTRYLINDACVRLGKPNIHAAIYRFEGQLTVFWPGYEKQRTGCYRCMFPEPPPPEFAPSCSETGVLGVLPGVLGTLQAVETIKVLLGIGEPLVGRMLYYDALKASVSEWKLPRRKQCPTCGDEARFTGYTDYAQVCASPG